MCNIKNRLMDMLDRISYKFLSGRFLFTLASIFVFVILSLNKTLPLDFTKEVVLLVIYAYFNRSDRFNKNNIENRQENGNNVNEK